MNRHQPAEGSMASISITSCTHTVHAAQDRPTCLWLHHVFSCMALAADPVLVMFFMHAGQHTATTAWQELRAGASAPHSTTPSSPCVPTVAS